MRAIIKQQVSNAKQPDNKEQVSHRSVIAKVRNSDGKAVLREVVTARFYMGRSSSASVVYCALWVHGNLYTSGKGSASGWGYHKESAALASAISDAGIELYGSAYSPRRWNDNERREYTPAEMRSMAAKAARQRAHIGGVGDSAMDAALEAIAKAAGAIGQCLIVRG